MIWHRNLPELRWMTALKNIMFFGFILVATISCSKGLEALTQSSYPTAAHETNRDEMIGGKATLQSTLMLNSPFSVGCGRFYI